MIILRYAMSNSSSNSGIICIMYFLRLYSHRGIPKQAHFSCQIFLGIAETLNYVLIWRLKYIITTGIGTVGDVCQI